MTVVDAQTGVLTGIPIIRDNRKDLQYLPFQARYVIEALQEKGRSDVDELVTLLGSFLT